MTTNLAPAPAHQHGHAVHALAGLLGWADLSDICTWTLRDDAGIQGQLSAVYTDPEADARIRELAGLLERGRVVTREASGHRGPFVAVEAVGTAAGVPVTLWTHLHDRDAIHEARRHEGVAR